MTASELRDIHQRWEAVVFGVLGALPIDTAVGVVATTRGTADGVPVDVESSDILRRAADAAAADLTAAGYGATDAAAAVAEWLEVLAATVADARAYGYRNFLAYVEEE